MDWIIIIGLTLGIAYLAEETLIAIENTKNHHHADEYWIASMVGMFILMAILATC